MKKTYLDKKPKREHWRNIPGYDGAYKINRNGDVKSKYKRGGLLNPGIDSAGYYRVNLSKNGKIRTRRIHRLLAEAFLPNPNGYNCVNHIDGNKLNNNLDNLEWCSYSQNLKHAIDNELTPLRGETCHFAKLSENDVLEMRSAFNLGCFTYRDMSDAYNISRSHAYGIINRDFWTHI